MTKRAFTLIETVVVVAITTIVILALDNLLVYFYQTNTFLFNQAMAVDGARRGIDDAAKYLRQAIPGSDGSYPVITAATSSVAFWADPGNDGTLERVTYLVEDATLYRTLQTSNAVATTTLATAVTTSSTTPLFRYFDASGSELMQPVVTSRIASVETTLVVDADSNRGRSPIILTGAATLRNNWNRP